MSRNFDSLPVITHMPTLFLLFSHTLTQEQIVDARQTLGVTEFAALETLQARWSDVPPDLENITEHLRPIFVWLTEQTHPGDYVLIQGDFGAVCATVHFALARDLIPIYATTERQVTEIPLPDGTVQIQRIFRHVRYRRYHLPC